MQALAIDSEVPLQREVESERFQVVGGADKVLQGMLS